MKRNEFIGMKIQGGLKRLKYGKCVDCSKIFVDEIVNCPIIKDRELNTCQKWNLLMISLQDHFHRLLAERQMIAEIRGKKRFKDFIKNNLENLYIYRLEYLHNFSEMENQNVLIAMYDVLIEEWEYKKSN